MDNIFLMYWRGVYIRTTYLASLVLIKGRPRPDDEQSRSDQGGRRAGHGSLGPAQRGCMSCQCHGSLAGWRWLASKSNVVCPARSSVPHAFDGDSAAARSENQAEHACVYRQKFRR